jgi:hypothetical protein
MFVLAKVIICASSHTQSHSSWAMLINIEYIVVTNGEVSVVKMGSVSWAYAHNQRICVSCVYKSSNLDEVKCLIWTLSLFLFS